MEDLFSVFSKGNVICKYQMVERIGDHKRRDRLFTAILIIWIIFWISVATRVQYSWVTIAIAFFPIPLGSLLFKLVFPYRTVGLVTFQGSKITFSRDTESEKSIDLNKLRSFQIFRSIPRTFHSKVRTDPKAYGIIIRKGDETWEYHMLNEMHLTKADELQFMSPPPLLSVTLSTMTQHFKIRYYDLRGRELDLIP